jgi:putative transposase
MSIYLHKSHNVSVLLYHIVCPAKYRRVIFTDEVDEALKEVCMEIGKRYEIHFVEIGTDQDHVHFLVQSVPMYSPTKLVKVIKSITAREVFRRVPSVRKELWGGEFWTDGYYVNTVSKYGNEDVIREYVEGQGGKGQYKKLHNGQLRLF